MGRSTFGCCLGGLPLCGWQQYLGHLSGPAIGLGWCRPWHGLCRVRRPRLALQPRRCGALWGGAAKYRPAAQLLIFSAPASAAMLQCEVFNPQPSTRNLVSSDAQVEASSLKPSPKTCDQNPLPPLSPKPQFPQPVARSPTLHSRSPPRESPSSFTPPVCLGVRKSLLARATARAQAGAPLHGGT